MQARNAQAGRKLLKRLKIIHTEILAAQEEIEGGDLFGQQAGIAAETIQAARLFIENIAIIAVAAAAEEGEKSSLTLGLIEERPGGAIAPTSLGKWYKAHILEGRGNL